MTIRSNASTSPVSDCPVCGSPGSVASSDIEGYIAGWRSALLVCDRCDLSFSARRDIPTGLYDAIYLNSGSLPGYKRYDGYEARSRRKGAGLSWLAEQEAPYSAVQMLLSRNADNGPIMELGCGRGYLTQALRRDGFDAVGVDISREAVEKAKAHWSDESAFLTVEEAKSTFTTGFQTVIALEVIEHVSSPLDFVRDALEYVVPGGALLLTTPNRDAYTRDVIWASDVPPVHLTWFGTNAMARIADMFGCAIEFLPLTDDASMPFPRPRADAPLTGLLSATGTPTKFARMQASAWSARLANQLGRLRKAVRPDPEDIVGMPRDFIVTPTSTTLAAVLVKPA